MKKGYAKDSKKSMKSNSKGAGVYQQTVEQVKKELSGKGKKK